MNLITPPVKRPSTLLPCLLLGLVFAAGCDATKPTVSTAPTPREAELTKTVAELNGKLAASEQATAQAKAQTVVALAEVKNTPAPQAKAEPVAETATPAAPQGTDTAYVVANKSLTPGELIPATTGADPNATERRAAEYWITFKGVQSGKTYPALAVKEASYNDFREGVEYTQQELNQAKIAALASDATGTPPPK